MFLYISIYVLSIVIVAKGKNISIYVYVVHIYMTRYSVSNHWQAAVVWEILPPQHVLDISLAIDWSYSTRCTSPILSENRRAKKNNYNKRVEKGNTNGSYIHMYIYTHHNTEKHSNDVGHTCEPKHIAMDTRSNTCWLTMTSKHKHWHALTGIAWSNKKCCTQGLRE